MVDPATNRPGGGRVLDDSSATVTVAPDGSVLYGAYTRYNYAQGHLMQFSAGGNFLRSYPFGWDLTAAIRPHGGTYSIVIKDNPYGEVGSYCNDPDVCPEDRDATTPDDGERYYISQLDSHLHVEWSFLNTNQDSCVREDDDSVSCVADHPHSFEWCVNAAVIDKNGVTYANSEDGWLYAINPNGTLRDRIFQQTTLGAAYTPASLGRDGIIYSQNSGHPFAVGR